MKKIIFIRGLWSHPHAVRWIKNRLEESTGIDVDLFDYHDNLVCQINNDEYLKRVMKEYSSKYKGQQDLILVGHSHGAALASIINEEFLTKKIVLVNPAIKPWGVFRRIPNAYKKALGYCGFGNGYQPHFEEKYAGEWVDRVKYFADNFELFRDTSRLLAIGNGAIQSLKSVRNDLLLIQSMLDEFVSVSTNMRVYNQIQVESDGSKELVTVEEGEHAVLEEKDIYPKIYDKINTFIKR